MHNKQTEQAALLSLIRPIHAQNYVIAKGWHKVETQSNQYYLFSHPDMDLMQILIPKEPNTPDYSQRLLDVANRLSDQEERLVLLVLRDMIRPDSDCLHFSQHSPKTNSGRIALREGFALLDGIRDVLLSSACGVVGRQLFFKRMHRTEASNFLNSCMLEQTAFGSYIMNISCPLSALEDENAHPELFPKTPLVRQFIEYTMCSASRLVKTIEDDEISMFIENTLADANDNRKRAPVVNANFCKALLDIHSSQEESELEVSATWAPMRPESESPGIAVFRQEYFEKIEEIYEKLRPSVEHEQDIEIIGTVEELSGDLNDAGKRYGSVKLQLFDADSDRLISASVHLSEDDYLKADEAHMKGSYVRVTAKITQRSRNNVLTKLKSFELLE